MSDPAMRQVLVERALKGYEKTGTIRGAARVAKVAPRTIREWLHADPMLKSRFREADELVTDRIEECAIKQAEAGSAQVTIHLLSSRRDRYKHKTTVSVETPDLASAIEKLRQVAVAQPTLAPMLKQALQLALEKMP